MTEKKTTKKESGTESGSKKSDNEKTSGKGKAIATAAGVAAAAAAGVAAVKAVKGSKAKRTIYHLLPREDDWEIRAEDAKKASSVHATKKEGLGVARELARDHEPSQLVVHKSDGTIETSYNYGEE